MPHIANACSSVKLNICDCDGQLRAPQQQRRLQQLDRPEKELQLCLLHGRRKVVIVVFVFLVQPGLHPVQAEIVQQSRAKEQGQVLRRRREGSCKSDVHV
jgi:hypothetical protein